MAQASAQPATMASKSVTDPEILAFMDKASEALGYKLPAPKDVYAFALDLHTQNAIDGKKTATTSWPIPKPVHWGIGDYSVGLSQAGKPAMIMRTLSLVECRFGDVAEDFALAEAEGDYQEYHDGHVEWYGRSDPNGYLFDDDSMVLCERFECIYPRTGIDPPTL